MQAKFPRKLGFLFAPQRYKVARGGRGSGKSWGFARALLLLGKQRKKRYLCTREIQKSIQQSVHKLLCDQIAELDLSHFYRITQNAITGLNGTEFAFSGLKDQTVDSIKSYESIDVVWVEEGQSVSKRSWDILIPTLRKSGSEIWVTYNPELETDETHQRFAVKPPPNCTSVLMNYMDNPWFPAELEAERLYCLQTNPKDYDNIWLGKCKPAVSGAIYYDEVASAEEQHRIADVPYESFLKVHAVFDLGFNDSMAIALVQKHHSGIRIIEYIEDSHKTLDYYSTLLKEKGLNWGKVYLPHDGRHKDYKTGKSTEEIMQGMGWDVEITPNMSIEQGIIQTRMTFPRIVFDKTKTQRLIECAKRYRRHINTLTQEPTAPLHDEFSHGADVLRYVAINAESMTNEQWGGALNYAPLGII